jgi:hypothetical protein
MPLPIEQNDAVLHAVQRSCLSRINCRKDAEPRGNVRRSREVR